MDVYASSQGLSVRFWELRDVGWTAWSSLVSVVTWVYLYRLCRPLHWLVLPVMGLVSPVTGAVVFVIPFLGVPWVVLWLYAQVIFPVGLATGRIISAATLPLRPRHVWTVNS